MATDSGIKQTRNGKEALVPHNSEVTAKVEPNLKTNKSNGPKGQSESEGPELEESSPWTR